LTSAENAEEKSAEEKSAKEKVDDVEKGISGPAMVHRYLNMGGVALRMILGYPTVEDLWAYLRGCSLHYPYALLGLKKQW